MRAVGNAMTADQHRRATAQGAEWPGKLAIVAGLASLGLAGFAVALMHHAAAIPCRSGCRLGIGREPTSASRRAHSSGWPSAPGRVEPRSGLIRIGTSLPGKVEAVAVNMNDRVAEGEVLIRLEDKEARARLSAAEAKAAASKSERDAGRDPGRPREHQQGRGRGLHRRARRHQRPLRAR